MSEIIIQGPQAHLENQTIEKAHVVINNGKIQSISQKKDSEKKQVLSFPTNYHLVPGFIDLHIHGAAGKDVMDGSPAALSTIAKALAQEGVTSFLATTLSQEKQKIENALENVHTYVQQKNHLGAEILGIHLEGPFISSEKPGSHKPEMIIKPDIDLFKAWQEKSGKQIKLVTLAPEIKGAHSLINHLKKEKIVASIGHSNASYEETMEAIELGCTYATHLFNSMTSFHHRKPGCIAAILLHPAVTAEIIVDLVHLHPAAVELAYKLKKANLLVLITDAMRGKCMKEGTYELGGQEVFVKKQNKQLTATLKDQTLAGSLLKMDEAIKNMSQICKSSLSELIQMSSTNPAKVLGIDSNKGSIAPKKDADLVVLDDQLRVVLTLCKGKIAYQKKG